MPVIVLEARDFTNPLSLVRTLEIIFSCITFSFLTLVETSELNQNFFHLPYFNIFRNFCMFTWAFFFTITLLIHILTVIQFHSIIPISWKNLTMTVAVLGALMCFTASLLFPGFIMDHAKVSPCAVTVAVAACLTFMAYSSESYILHTQTHEQRGYMGSMPGLLKILQLWGGCHILTLFVTMCQETKGVSPWQLWVSGVSYIVCVLVSLVTLVVILGDLAGRCFLPFDRFLAAFSLTGVLFYMISTMICFTKILHLKDLKESTLSVELVILEMVVAGITLVAYTVDLAFSIKLLCDRSHM